MQLGLVRATGTNPYQNLALERYLLETVAADQVVLYLWQNQNTVVIGRNQSALSECRIQQLEHDGGHLARRLSGGGAVFHDLGNLNFTFLLPSELFDEGRQTEVVLRAVQMLGIEAERTGRNDLLAGGAKFSGHAYYHTRGKSYHHGTLLVNVDAQKMAQYLNPSPLKLAAKGVASVKSRVCNLVDFVPGLTVQRMAQAMVAAFEDVYGDTAQELQLGSEAQAVIADYAQEFASREWLLRGELPLENSAEAKFDWGLVRVDWTEAGGAFSRVALYSDGLEADFLGGVAAALQGCTFTPQAMQAALQALADDSVESSAAAKQACINDITNLVFPEGLEHA